MLHTPESFLALIDPQDHPDPQTFIFRGHELLVRDADLTLPQDTAAALADGAPNAMHAVGLLGQRYCQTGWVERTVEPAPGYTFKALRALFGSMDEGLLGVAGRACQIVEWARTHRFCGTCGTPARTVPGERCLRCPECGHASYPRISPAMMVLIKKDDRILLAHHASAPTRRFSPLAGFLEAGESIEEAIHREVFEEVGLRVTNLNYFGSQSWPFPHSLMIAFTADHADGEIAIDQEEIVEARWFGPDDALPQYSAGISIAGALIEAFWPGASPRQKRGS
jgi:NAD+ diphosphatase